jgi:ABC-2 type transport system permease protein
VSAGRLLSRPSSATRCARLVRVVSVGLALHFKMLSRSPFDLWVVVASPIIFSTLAYFLFEGEGHGPRLLVLAIASAVMGIWSSTTASGAGALQRQRRLGVLELLVASPAPFWSVVLPITVAISAIGIYSLATGLVYVRVLFGVAISLHDWPAFVVAVPATIVSIGMLGFLLSSALVRFRSAFMLGNLFEWPVWTISGLLIPVAVLPGWVTPLSWLFAPTWGMAALRGATLGTGTPWRDIGMCAALSIVYGVLGSTFLRVFLHSARVNATLALT